MDTKKLNLQGVAAGSMSVDNELVNNEKAKKAATVAGVAAAGLAVGGGAIYAGKEVYDSMTGHSAADEADVNAAADDAALDVVAGLSTSTDATAPVVEADPVVVAEPVEASTTATTTHTTTSTTTTPASTTTTTPASTTTTTTPTNTVNPDDVSDEILAADIIDPTDAEAGDFPYEVGEVAQVYNVNGELETVATITDENGAEMMLVDVNGDQMFDVARNAYGDEVELGVVSSVDDMQLIHAQQQGDGIGYLAATDNPAAADDNSFEADIVDPTTLA